MGGRSRIIDLTSSDQTIRFGKHAAQLLVTGSVLALSGPLGVGKTFFIQGLALGLNIVSSIQSPTFNYFHSYTEGSHPLFHFDLYRMKNPSDFFSMGFEEYFDAGGITAIEWPERLGRFVPFHALSLRFSYLETGRRVHLSSAIDPELIDSLAKWD